MADHKVFPFCMLSGNSTPFVAISAPRAKLLRAQGNQLQGENGLMTATGIWGLSARRILFLKSVLKIKLGIVTSRRSTET